ncbi:hypothetical protein ACVIWV_000013 [Bradyrhizobium diazoefficiens]|uniref:hypothetical protein n=1 Tax=Bradyrhizobium TaxID=374 RepID=UPI001B8D65CD|nr:hypothetical protein [Bradyrhizobium diazoefficiens]MBR0868636.1 hypothetical protein [Bradyrhizobium diazoefficiens]MBR0893178.1 hypothetical protein [Bradyrhizobium diazoefficiens]MBR0924879.1 hypothetical protein [Bradyrhizobium diazoefficiens]
MGLRGQMALLGISGVLVTGAICAAALNYASIVQNESSDANRFRIRVTSLSQGFLQSRQIASDFLRKPSEVSIKSHDEKYERQLADLSSVETFAAALSGDDPLKEATSMRTVINLYETRFHNVVACQRNLGFNEDDGFQGKLRRAVHSVEQRLAELNQPRLTILMLMMRRHEKDFILRAEDRYGDKLVDQEAEFEATLAQGSLPADVKSQILELVPGIRAE